MRRGLGSRRRKGEKTVGGSRPAGFKSGRRRQGGDRVQPA